MHALKTVDKQIFKMGIVEYVKGVLLSDCNRPLVFTVKVFVNDLDNAGTG